AEDGIRDDLVTGVQTCALPIFDQLRRATISIGANIVEGYALSTPLQFRRHLRIALGSAAEAEYLTSLIAELEYLPTSTTTEMEEIGRASCRERVKSAGRDDTGR